MSGIEEITPQNATFEGYVLWYLQQKGGTLSYVTCEKPNPDLNCVCDVTRVFGRPVEEESELLDAIAYLDDIGQLVIQTGAVQKDIVGGRGKVCPEKIRVVVSQR
jgi:hypothetical protein